MTTMMMIRLISLEDRGGTCASGDSWVCYGDFCGDNYDDDEDEDCDVDYELRF